MEKYSKTLRSPLAKDTHNQGHPSLGSPHATIPVKQANATMPKKPVRTLAVDPALTYADVTENRTTPMQSAANTISGRLLEQIVKSDNDDLIKTLLEVMAKTTEIT